MPLTFKSFNELVNLTTNVNGTTYDRFGKIVGVDYSLSSVSIGLGTKTFVIDGTSGVDRDYKIGDIVLVTAKAGTTGTMKGTVLLYTASNRALTLNISDTTGSGTGSQWRLTKPMPRVDYHPDTRTVRGVRIEPSSTNLFLNSYLATPNSVPAGATQAVVSEIANPEGHLSVRRINVSTAGTIRFGTTSGGVSGTRYVGSVFIRTVAGPENQNITANITCDFNNSTATAFVIDSTKWYRVHATAATANTNRFLDVNVPVGDYYVFGIQHEAGFFRPTSYIPTRGTTETREVDTIRSTEPDYIQSLINSGPFSVVVKAEHEVFVEDDNLAYSVATVSDGTADNIISFQLNNQNTASNSARISVVSGGNSVYSHSFANNSFEIGNSYRLGVSINNNSFISAFHNTLGSVVTSGVMPAVNEFWIGSTNGTLDQWQGWVSEFALYPYAMTSEQLLEATDTVGTPLIHSL